MIGMTETTRDHRDGGGHDEPRDRWVDAGIWVVGLTAAVASWAGWVGLAKMCGWTDAVNMRVVHFQLAWLLPIAVDVYALTGFRVWLRVDWASETTRNYARLSTFAAIGLGVAGNGGYHLMVSLGWTVAPGAVVVLVSSLPPIMLGAVAHLSAIATRDRTSPRPAEQPKTEVSANETTPVAPVETTPARLAETTPPTAQPTVNGGPVSSPMKPPTRRVDAPRPTPAKVVQQRSAAPVQTPEADQLKAIRETHPDWATKTVSLGQIKKAVGITGQATAVRLKNALYPNGTPDPARSKDDPDGDKERALDPLTLTSFTTPKTPAMAGVNGHRPNLEES